MEALLQYAFMDESGTVGVTGAHFLIVAATTLPNPREIEKPVRNAFRQALKIFGADKVNEVKAADLDEPVVLRLLAELAEKDIRIFITIVDQQAIRIPPRDKEEIYRQAAAGTVRRLAEKFPHLELSIDKRHTNAHLRRLLEKAIRDEIESLPRQNVLIQQENSITRKELQAADAVAWAIFQKYEHDDLRFYELIQSKVVDETVISQKDWR